MSARSKGRRARKRLRKETRQHHGQDIFHGPLTGASRTSRQRRDIRRKTHDGILGLGIMPRWFF